MDYYLIIKNIHITTAILSFIGFCIRGYWMLNNQPLLNNKLTKILPHINDTFLLIAAIYLSIASGLYPFVVGWLGLKVLFLIGYIFAGVMALKLGKSKKIRVAFFILAIGFIASIFLLALTKP